MVDQFKSFERAFDSHAGSCRRTCECGREFWDSYNSGYTWEDGELEALAEDGNATALPYSVSTIEFEGRSYVMDCTCWQKRAEKIIGFIEGHAHQIAFYLRLEKDRKQAMAAAPTV